MGTWAQTSWVVLSENLSCGCHQEICCDCNLICSLGWGRVYFQAYLWLPVRFFFSTWTIGLRAPVCHRLCFKCLSPVPHCRGAPLIVACEWESETGYLRKKTFCNFVLEGTPHHVCHIPFVRSASINPAHNQRDGIIQRSEYWESSHFRGCLPSTSGKLKKKNTHEITFSVAIPIIVWLATLPQNLWFLFSKL